MTHSTYQDALVLTKRAMEQTIQILKVAQKHVQENGLDEATFLASRLAPDMYPLTKQIQVASDNAKGLASRISGQANPSMSDTEQTFPELIERIEKTLSFVSSVSPMEDTAIDAQDITFVWNPGKAIKGYDCIVLFNLPNLYFHVSMAYAIIRNQGVNIGKTDFIGSVPFYDLAK